ncbi:hypothetical protein ACFVAE_09335 [Microbacterium sp. NPDC057659]|uniref:hypothetical protein n=1 Tax=Microbacterium sp. NPDC057659 TaxID=3346198 RepID=UPI0036704092
MTHTNGTATEEWTFGRFVHEHSSLIAAITMMVVGVVVLVFPSPRTAQELLAWLGAGVGILSGAASVMRVMGHRHVRWPEPTPEPDYIDRLPESEWRDREIARRDYNDARQLAVKSGYDLLGKLLALDAAAFAIFVTIVHFARLNGG